MEGDSKDKRNNTIVETLIKDFCQNMKIIECYLLKNTTYGITKKNKKEKSKNS